MADDFSKPKIIYPNMTKYLPFYLDIEGFMVNQKQLTHTLDQVVETVVNHVGVELNTASPAILQHVAGISSA
ncbi:MAG: hypothetical protein ACFN4A_05470, partial [Streptococcus mutans]